MTKLMQMNYLSYKFYFNWTKYLMITIGFIINIIASFIIVKTIVNKTQFDQSDTFVVLSVFFIYVVFSSFFYYYLFKSTDVMFDNKYIYIGNKKNNLKEIKLSHINKLKRKMLFFYLISFDEKQCNCEPIYVFMSMDIVIGAHSKIKKLRKFLDESQR